jgi:hypothetical protein
MVNFPHVHTKYQQWSSVFSSSYAHGNSNHRVNFPFHHLVLCFIDTDLKKLAI